MTKKSDQFHKRLKSLRRNLLKKDEEDKNSPNTHASKTTRTSSQPNNLNRTLSRLKRRATKALNAESEKYLAGQKAKKNL